MTQSSAIIKFDSVNKRFGEIQALSDLSFEIGEGELIFLVGPSGSGKTTVLNLLLAKFPPSGGKIFFEGKDITSLTKKELPLFRQKIGAVFQDFKLLPERTARENIEVALAVKGENQEEWSKRVDQVLELVGLADRGELFPAQLSGGEIQRVALARALVVNPTIVFADEPTGNLDWDTAETIIELLAEINQQGKTVIIATHHQGIIDKFGKKVIELKKPVQKKEEPEVKEEPKEEKKTEEGKKKKKKEAKEK